MRKWVRLALGYAPCMPVHEWRQSQREFCRYGYDPYNSADAFAVWQRHHPRPD